MGKALGERGLQPGLRFASCWVSVGIDRDGFGSGPAQVVERLLSGLEIPHQFVGWIDRAQQTVLVKIETRQNGPRRFGVFKQTLAVESVRAADVGEVEQRRRQIDQRNRLSGPLAGWKSVIEAAKNQGNA